MAIDITKGTHVVSFPSRVASVLGQYGHVFNTVVTETSADNGTICAKGDYVHFDQYEQEALEAADVITGKIIDQDANGLWYVEITGITSDKTVLYMYNSPVSEYSEREFQDEKLFFNKQNEVVQGAMLMVTDVAEYSDEAFEGTPAPDTAVTYNVATNKWTI